MVLLEKVRTGDDDALNALLDHLLPRLRRWAHGRLPRSARGLLGTDDIVLQVAAKAARRFAVIDIAEAAALTAFLRQAIRNELIDQYRKARPEQTEVSEALMSPDPSPLDAAIGQERLAQYERALAALSDTDQAAIVGRFELGYSYAELATLLGRPNAEAARQAVLRSLGRLIDEVSGA